MDGFKPLQALRRGDPIVILTGAGISKESGLDTFRDPDGIWMRVRIEDVATPAAFARDPARVHEFYNARRRALHDPAIRPNAAHLALARLEQEWPGAFLLVTQNVDDLHDRAGGAPLHMHGEIAKVRCLRCGSVRAWHGDLSVAAPCPACGRAGGLRPEVVWFGEMPHEMERIETAVGRCRLFVAIGTSGLVYPAAGLVHRALDAGALTAELNLAVTPVGDLFEMRIEGPATITVPALVDALLDLP